MTGRNLRKLYAIKHHENSIFSDITEGLFIGSQWNSEQYQIFVIVKSNYVNFAINLSANG